MVSCSKNLETVLGNGHECVFQAQWQSFLLYGRMGGWMDEVKANEC